jgi:hypothetical protein
MPVYSDPGLVTFDAVIHRNDGGGSFVEFPGDVAALFGVRGRVPVIAKFDGADYRGSIMPYNGVHMIGVTLALQAAMGKSAGQTVHVELQLDSATRVIELDADVVEALDRAGLLHRFREQSYSHQREYAQWIASAKRAETRASRITKMLDLLAQGKPLT